MAFPCPFELRESSSPVGVCLDDMFHSIRRGPVRLLLLLLPLLLFLVPGSHLGSARR